MERTVGVFFFVGLVMLLLLTVWVDDEGLIFRDRSATTYRARFPSAEGLREGDPVFLAGYQVGRIETIALTAGGVDVSFTVGKGYKLKADSEALIDIANLLGGSRLNLTLGKADSAELKAGDYLAKASVGAGLSSLVAEAQGTMNEIKGVVSDSREDIRTTIKNIREVSDRINKGEGTIGKLINDPALHDKLTAAVDEIRGGMENLKEITGKVKDGEGFLARLVNDKELFDKVNAAAGDIQGGMASLRKIADQVAEGKGTVGKLVMEEELYADLKGALASLREISDKVNRGEGTVGKLVNDPALYAELTGAVESLARVVRKIDSGEGAIGKLVNDPALYDDARRLLRGLDEAVEDAREQAPISAFSSVVFGAFQ